MYTLPIPLIEVLDSHSEVCLELFPQQVLFRSGVRIDKAHGYGIDLDFGAVLTPVCRSANVYAQIVGYSPDPAPQIVGRQVGAKQLLVQTQKCFL